MMLYVSEGTSGSFQLLMCQARSLVDPGFSLLLFHFFFVFFLFHGHMQAPSMVSLASENQSLVCRGMSSAKKCGSVGFGRTLEALLGPLPRCNDIMFQDQGSNGTTRSISHAKSLQRNANAQVHLNITKRKLIHFSNRTYLGLSKHGKAYVAQPRRAHIPKSLLELAGAV